MSTFKVGDQVQLKSGGPIMTIARVTEVDEDEFAGGIRIGCQWFVKDEVKSHPFHPDVLELYDDENSAQSVMPLRG